MDTISEKTLCVMGNFDEGANTEFKKLFDRLARQGIELTAQKPHITFGIYDKLDAQKLQNWIEGIALRQSPIDLYFNHIGLFAQGICIAEPCANMELLQLHSQIHSRFDRDCIDSNCLFSLKSKSWVPHTTLAVLPPDRICSMLSSVMEVFKPINATITALSITEYAPLKYLKTYPLIPAAGKVRD